MKAWRHDIIEIRHVLWVRGIKTNKINEVEIKLKLQSRDSCLKGHGRRAVKYIRGYWKASVILVTILALAHILLGFLLKHIIYTCFQVLSGSSGASFWCIHPCWKNNTTHRRGRWPFLPSGVQFCCDNRKFESLKYVKYLFGKSVLTC